MFLTTCFLGSSQVTLVKDFINGTADSYAKPFFQTGNGMCVVARQSTSQPAYFFYKTFDGTFLSNYEMLNGTNQVYTNYQTFDESNYTVVSGVGYFAGKIGSNNYMFYTNSNFDALVIPPFQNDHVINPVVNGNKLFNTGFNTTNGQELAIWAPPTFQANDILVDINPVGSSFPLDFIAFNTSCVFTADDGTNGRELWISDGTSIGTNMLSDINAGSASSNPDNITVFGTQIVFSATHATLGKELFKVNSSGTLSLIKDFNSGNGNGNPNNIYNANGVLYFSADNGSIGQELWKSNGTALGTVLIKDINPLGASNPRQFTQIGSTIFFIADDGTNGVELWKTDGTSSGTVLVKNINLTGNSNPNNLTEYNGKLYFDANDASSGINRQLWVSDGTTSGTQKILVNSLGDASPENFLVFQNKLYFGASDGVHGHELFSYMDPALAANDFELAGNAINLYPNPAKSYFELATTINVEKVELYSLQGQLVKTFVNQNQYEINDLAKGMYIVKVNAQEGVANKTLVIE